MIRHTAPKPYSGRRERGGTGEYSGVAMKSGWEVKELGTVSAINYGYTESASSEPVGPRFLRITDIQDDHVDWDSVPYCKIESADVAKYRLASGDIVFARTGATTGKSFLVKGPPEAIFASYLIRLRLLDKKLLPEFVSLFFQTADYWKLIEAGSSGSAQGGFNATKLGALSIPVPPLPEQRRIVRILDKAFDGIATAKANAEKNLQNARALFESELAAVFSQRGKGWEDIALGDVCGFVRGPFGGSLKKSIFVADGYAVYEQQHAICDQFDDVRYFIDEAKFKEMKRFELFPNDLIMSCSGTMGRVAIVPNGIKRGIINQALLKLTPTAKVSNAFLKFWMESQSFQDALKEYSGGAAIQNVASVKALKEIKVPLPSVTDQERVVAKLDVLREETQRLGSIYQRKLAALDALKKSLLHQAFNGKL
jgi:type I restriction enzyme, S subunit